MITSHNITALLASERIADLHRQAQTLAVRAPCRQDAQAKGLSHYRGMGERADLAALPGRATPTPDRSSRRPPRTEPTFRDLRVAHRARPRAGSREGTRCPASLDRAPTHARDSWAALRIQRAPIRVRRVMPDLDHPASTGDATRGRELQPRVAKAHASFPSNTSLAAVHELLGDRCQSPLLQLPTCTWRAMRHAPGPGETSPR
jgi:hypothetical protein